LADAERAYHMFKRKMSESSIDLILRLRTVYTTACLASSFAGRYPEHTLPETLVRSLDDSLHFKVVDGLKKQYLLWPREKLEKHSRTSPDSIRSILTKIATEIYNQLQMAKPPRVTTAVSFQPQTLGRRLPFGRRPGVGRRSELAYAAHQPSDDPDTTPLQDETDALRALTGRVPTPSRPPVGILGPTVPSASRFPNESRYPAGSRPPPSQRRPPDESRQGRFTLGHANYGGCHNCGDKGHMAAECSKPIQAKLRALVDQSALWTMDDAEAFLEQGLPPCVDKYWEDPEDIMDYCQRAVDAGHPVWTEEDEDMDA
jgi:hypothetical protein